MIPLKQRNRHDPDNGVWGDCHRAAIASVLELSLDDVPHFFEGGRGTVEARILEKEFLRDRGLVAIDIGAGSNLEETLDAMGVWNPGVYYLLAGKSRNNVTHSVVCLNDKIVHDPSLDDSGIIGPDEKTGLYWVTFFGTTLATLRRIL